MDIKSNWNALRRYLAFLSIKYIIISYVYVYCNWIWLNCCCFDCLLIDFGSCVNSIDILIVIVKDFEFGLKLIGIVVVIVDA